MYDIAFVGTGADPDDPDTDGFAMAYRHAAGYERLEDCSLVACADIVPENARRFATEHGIEAANVYEDYERMLRECEPDVVSVCVPPAVHADIVVGCARSGVPRAVHCEKPMATTWGDCKRMTRACAEAGVQLTVNHQRRTGRIYREAKSLLDVGKVGELRRIEWAAPNLFDAGTHLFDLSNFYAGGTEVEWVLCGLDYREENRWFGAHNENQAIAQWRYADGTWARATTGVGEDALGCTIRLVGTNGVVEVGADGGAPLRYRNGRTLGWSAVDVGENAWGDTNLATWRAGVRVASATVPGLPDDLFGTPGHVETGIASVVEALRTGQEPALSAENALAASELIFAAWESVRRRGRVDLPLRSEDNALEAMVENGDLALAQGGATGAEAPASTE